MIGVPLAMRLCGLLYIYILVTNAASVGLGNRTGETDSAAKLPVISEKTRRYRTGVLVAVESHLGIVAIAGTPFLAFSPQNRVLALVGSLTRLGEAAAMIYGEITVLKLVDLAREYALADSDKVGLASVGDRILRTKNAGVALGLLLLAIGATAYCYSFVRSGAVPPAFAWLGLAAGVISAVGILIKFATSFGTVAMIGMVRMMVFEVVFGGWLILFSHGYVGGVVVQ